MSAFALPLFTTIARMSFDGRRSSASLTGAAFARFTVKQPTATHGASLKTSAMSLRIVLMPALTPANEKPRGVFNRASYGKVG